MLVADMTYTEKKRYDKKKICPICGQEITEIQNCEYLKFRRNRNLSYVFFHTECLVNQGGVEDGEQETE